MSLLSHSQGHVLVMASQCSSLCDRKRLSISHPNSILTAFTYLITLERLACYCFILHIYIYIYTHIYIYVYVCVCVCVYTYKIMSFSDLKSLVLAHYIKD